MSKAGLWAIAGIAVATLLYLVYLAATFEAPVGTTTVAIPAPNLQPLQPETETQAPRRLPTSQLAPAPEPVTANTAQPAVVAPAPVEVAVPETATPLAAVELPRLGDSDNFVLNGLRAVQNSAALMRWLSDQQMIRKFVVLVDNVSRGGFPQTALPYRPLGEEMPVTSVDDHLFVMDASAHARFDEFVNAFVALDTAQAMALYRTLSPLMQNAYSEIGFRDVDFNDTLRAAINRVLGVMDVPGPYQLVKPSVMYLYADAGIENLPAVNKQMIRLGADNNAKLKAKLRQFAALL